MSCTERRKRRPRPISLTITLKSDNNTTESKVEGTLDVDSLADFVIHGILLTIHGDVWTEITSRSSGQPRYSSNIFVQSMYILGNGSGTTVLTAGKQILPFTFCLPPHLPSSFNGIYGAINYVITAQIHSDNERNDETNKTSQPLNVGRFLDLSDGLAYGHAISYPLSINRPLKTLRTAFAPKFHLKFTFKVQKTGFASGEIIPFVLDVCNPERKKLASICVTLMKKTVYGDLKYSKDVFDELAVVNNLNIDNGKANLTWIGSLHVPQDTIPTHTVTASIPKKKPIFSHRYLLRVKLLPVKGNCVVGDMPIVIGSSKYECRSRRKVDHCSRSFARYEFLGTSLTSSGENQHNRARRQSSVPPSYSQTIYASERRSSLETLPPPYEEAIAMASKTLAKETRHLMG